MSIPDAAFAALLRPNERLVGCIAVQGFFASEHAVHPTNPHMVITDQRIVLASWRGLMKKRADEDFSWPLDEFTSRVNSNEGTALGPFLYVLSLFTGSGESVSAGFKNPQDRDEYKALVVAALAPILG